MITKIVQSQDHSLVVAELQGHATDWVVVGPGNSRFDISVRPITIHDEDGIKRLHTDNDAEIDATVTMQRKRRGEQDDEARNIETFDLNEENSIENTGWMGSQWLIRLYVSTHASGTMALEVSTS